MVEDLSLSEDEEDGKFRFKLFGLTPSSSESPIDLKDEAGETGALDIGLVVLVVFLSATSFVNVVILASSSVLSFLN